MRFSKLLAVLTFMLLIVGICFSSFVVGQQGDVSSAISVAQSKLVQCYDAARAAEGASANISQLTTRLNSASMLLSRAEFAYSNGDYESAHSLAIQCQAELASFVSDASTLQASAEQSRSFDFWINIVGSVAGTIVVIVGAVVVWVLLKRKYLNEKGVPQSESNTV